MRCKEYHCSELVLSSAASLTLDSKLNSNWVLELDVQMGLKNSTVRLYHDFIMVKWIDTHCDWKMCLISAHSNSRFVQGVFSVAGKHG